jgi:oligoribonuclease NrnB/cAMP/cGMP phosphodiesterase (DHH superfamily)
MKYYVIYHADCYDGFGAAWVAKKQLAGEDVTFIPAKHGDIFPLVEAGSVVYILDFSYPRTDMIDLAKRCQVQVLDHHKTAQANCEGLDFCCFDMERSGAGMTWDFFHDKAPRPAIINYVEDRDLWRFKLLFSREISAWMMSYPRDFDTWDTLAYSLGVDFDGAVHQGTAITRYETQKIEEVCKMAFTVIIAGYEVPVVNVPVTMGSAAAHRLLSLFPKSSFAAYYWDSQEARNWGLRGRDSDDFDVSEIAKKFGGGGHKKASGFRQVGINWSQEVK